MKNLINRGHLRKKDRSARSLEVVAVVEDAPIKTTAIKASEEKWLVGKIDYRFSQLENSDVPSQDALDGLYVLVGALKVLQLDGAASSFVARLSELKKRTVND